jgi:hypothetical protein
MDIHKGSYKALIKEIKELNKWTDSTFIHRKV